MTDLHYVADLLNGFALGWIFGRLIFPCKHCRDAQKKAAVK